MIAWASVQDLGTVFSSSDLTMALLADNKLTGVVVPGPCRYEASSGLRVSASQRRIAGVQA
jgi:nitrogen fixation protein FixH